MLQIKFGATSQFGANLRHLCEQQGSISNVCRKLSINRQQFNKYLSGSHVPSAQNMRIIANHFGLSVQILFSDPEEFKGLVDGNFFSSLEVLRSSQNFVHFFEEIALRPQTDDINLIGVYDRYQYSSIYERKILRSVYCIYKNDKFFQHYYLERFPSYDEPGKMDYVFKYHGFTFPVSGRIFAFDFESIQRNELTSAIFAPVLRSSKKFMFGVATGIAATMHREPFATKMALHYRGPGLIRREHLSTSTVLDVEDPSIPKEILQYLGSGIPIIRT